MAVQLLQAPALEPGIAQENSGVGFGFFSLSHSQKDQVRLAWHVMEWVGKPLCLERRKCHPRSPITSVEKAELQPQDWLKTHPFCFINTLC